MITTHVLDTAKGQPAAGVPITLERKEGAEWVSIARGVTDDDGRLRTLMDGAERVAGTYRLRFDVGSYSVPVVAFFPEVIIPFVVADPTQHYHVPLLLSPFGYSTYRGS
jgi:5-hydroxyisourate hydrolase